MSNIKSKTNIILEGKPYISLFSAILSLFVGFSVVAFFGAAAPILKEAMGLSSSQVGLLVATPTLTGGLLRIPFGVWADINGGKKPILILLFLTLLGIASFCVLSLIYPNGTIPKSLFPILLLCGALSGCGIGVFTAGIAHVSYWYPLKKQGTALGLYSGLGGISSGLTTALIPLGIYFIGFNNVYITWMFIAFFGMLLFLFTDRNAWYFQLQKHGLSQAQAVAEAKKVGQEVFPKGGTKKSFLTAVKNIKCWALAFIYFSTFGGSVALTAWLPTFWTSYYELPLMTAGLITGLMVVFSPFMRIFGGKLSDIFRAEFVSLFALFFCLIGSFILFFSSSAIVSGASLFVMMGGIGVSNASVFRLIPVYLSGAVGGAAGIIGGVGAFGGFLIPPILGMLVNIMGKDGYREGFVVFILLFTVCCFIMAVLTRERRIIS